ncbi:MAG TPA: enoyl-CoA hydratase/isomerase family protein [Streptosporangiaceae bacterium]
MADPRFTDVAVTISPDRVATVEIQRPPANYFDLALIDALASAYEYLGAEPACRSIVLCSAGRHFCAGARLGEPTGDAERDADPVDTDALYHRSLTLFSQSKPVVAAVQGGAVGGGAGLALSADFRVGEPASWFAFNFARLGIHQGFGISATLPRIAGQQRALELLYTGRRIEGADAQAAGLFDRLAEPGALREVATELAAGLAAGAPLAVQSIRRTMRAALTAEVRAAHSVEAREQRVLFATADFRRGVAAAARREDPVFEGD